MAILGSITINEIIIYEVDADPTTGGGLTAPSGSMAIMTDGSGSFIKGSGGDTDWTNYPEAAKLFAIQRSNHTGTQAASTITGLAAIATSGNKADIGLGNVDNTSDLDKPISTATQTALNNKQDSGNYITDLTGDVTASGPGSTATTLSSTGITANNYTSVSIDTKGRATAGKIISSSTVSSAQARTQTSFATITGLTSANLTVGLYRVKVFGRYQTAATTTGIGTRINAGTATISTINIDWKYQQAANGTAQDFTYKQLATNDNITSASVVAANTNYHFSGEGIIRITAQGTITCEYRTEVNTSAVTVQPDTVMIIEEI